jgi:Ser/Thr protein kinase RdoA (MazF antagonist)
MGHPTSRTATIREYAKQHDGSAEALLEGLLRDLFQVKAQGVAINYDQYSLNSLNGFFEADGKSYFFKFHQEENEEEMSGEYYRADILAKAGLPVDQPIMMSTLPGEQILVYRRRTDPRFSDVLRTLDERHDEDVANQAVDAERRLNQAVLSVYLGTLHPVTSEQVIKEPVHRLFHDRLVTAPGKSYPGGRLASFYVGKDFEFPGTTLSWEALASARFVVNGIEYSDTLGQLFDAAHDRLAPEKLADGGGVTAHGDAHNANVWFERHQGGAHLSFFDPAFAGEHIPTLLAEVKTTFHNILAHPYWLYDPAVAEQTFNATAKYENGYLFADFDWTLSPVREALLESKSLTMWKPLLATLKERSMLPSDWRKVVRLGLFLCPTLVMNLRAGGTSHNPTSSLIGLSVAMMVGSEPRQGADLITRFLEIIDPGM